MLSWMTHCSRWQTLLGMSHGDMVKAHLEAIYVYDPQALFQVGRSPLHGLQHLASGGTGQNKLETDLS